MYSCLGQRFWLDVGRYFNRTILRHLPSIGKCLDAKTYEVRLTF